MGADRNGGDNGDLSSQGKTDEPGAISERDPVPVRPRSEDLVVAAWVVDQNPSAAQDRLALAGPASSAPALAITEPRPGSPRKNEWNSA